MRRDLSLSSTIKGYFDPAGRSKSPFKPIALDRTAKVEPKSEAIRRTRSPSIPKPKFASTLGLDRASTIIARDRLHASTNLNVRSRDVR
jgi:hypothetical protein